MKLAFNLQKNCNNRNQINLNLIGALTSKPYAFHARSWELKSVNSIDILDTFMSSIRFDYRDKEILRVIPRNDE